MAAGATYESIATTTLSSTASSVTLSSIPSTYTDLRLVATYGSNTTGTLSYIRFNGDTGVNYSFTYLVGNGSAASSSRNTDVAQIGGVVNSFGSSSIPSMAQYDIMSYAGSTYKTVLTQGSNDINGSGSVERGVGLWRNTAAINSITIFDVNSRLYKIGSTFTLWGIKAA